MHRGARLVNAHFLEMMKRKEFDGFLSGFHLHRFEKGSTVCEPGGADDAVFIVVSGRLRAYLSCEGREFTLALLEQGAMFSTHTRAIVEASSYAELMVADTAVFQEKLARYPQFAGVMIGILAEFLGSAFTIIESLVFHDVRQRLAELLVAAVETDGAARTSDGVTVSLGLNTEDLGQLIGASRQTTSQLINDFIRQGLIEKTGGRSFLVKDLPGLKAACGDGEG
ncbi:Crp/Fnr family transcriptional regulator [Azospirillum sp.]|uniref:Crp/Fnr family transcriptional regulator n=1 Tax=Azospirillum sp. TaxID=34012 RepID=UPI002D65C29A|nr:Crp/Fnr family transcriptional regulator [Azospirillum sp.]HYD65456.1 Crp/Fnr family transcriptional regulator [Azospirillum sp.]